MRVFSHEIFDVVFGGVLGAFGLDLGAILDPRGSKNPPLERHFQPKRLQMSSTPIYGDRPGADLGAIWRRKRSKDAFPSIWGSDWKYFESIWDGFLKMFHDLSTQV